MNPQRKTSSEAHAPDTGHLGKAEIQSGLILLDSALQPIAAARELVGDEAGEQIDGGHGFGLGLVQPGFEHCGHAAEAELAQSAL